MEASDRPQFGALLREFRLNAGMTQQELAERAKLSVEAISQLERGTRTRPQRETVVLLGRALDLSPERHELLSNTIGVMHPPRPTAHGKALNASLLRLIRSDVGETAKHNLPQQLTSFIGRQREVAEIAALLRKHRLVTIVGAGGVGKTRVALQLGSEMLNGRRDGVWLVDLGTVADQTLVANAVLSALQLPSTTGAALDRVVAYLKTRRVLLLLDNCEHVIGAARCIASDIVKACPYVHVISTSREAFGVQGEGIYRLPSLTVPPESNRGVLNALTCSAVELFVERAVAVNPDFALTDDNVRDVAEICRRLDGIPLAIEMAAARVMVLEPRQIAQRLDQRFRLLTSGDSRGLSRHRTMTALIDWSYDLLTEREQRFFESLSVFAGGCTLEAAMVVCSIEQEDEFNVIEHIESLVRRSLLVAESAGDEQRYGLLESLRQYGRDKLIARRKEDEVERRHALFYVAWVERLEHALYDAPERARLSQVNRETQNLRAALEWTVAKRGDVIVGQRLAAARRVISGAFTLAEGRRWGRAALDLVNELTPSELVARLELSEAYRAAQSGERTASLAAAERALVLYRKLGDVLAIARAQYLVGSSLALLEKPAEAEPLLRDALRTARMHGDRRLEADALQIIGWVRGAVGDFMGARARLTETLGLAKLLAVEAFTASVTISLAENEADAGDSELALRLTVDLLATHALKMDMKVIAISNTGAYLIALSRFDEARAHANEGLELARGLQMVAMIAISLMHLALVAVLRPQVRGRNSFSAHAGTARLLGWFEARRTELGIPRARSLRSEYDRALAVIRDGMGCDELARLMAAGATMTEDEAVAQAQALE